MLVRTHTAGVGIWDVGILGTAVGQVVPAGLPEDDAPLPRFAKLQPGEAVLVTAACGGVESAVLQIALAVGAAARWNRTRPLPTTSVPRLINPD